jgi:poly(beta-D-mannuronate) lyase
MRFTLFFLFPIYALCRDIPVADSSMLKTAAAEAKPGDSLVLRNGEWRDTKLIFKGQGTAEAPITLRAESPGKTVFTGASALRIGGVYLVVEGLSFQNPDASVGDTVEFRIDSKLQASHCRVTNCELVQSVSAEKSDVKESRWIGIYGIDNRLDHCRVQGKTNKGATAVVWLQEGKKAAHHIDHNYFGPREALGKNGGETLRVGDSESSMQTAGCLVEANYFERCNGELECISNKSCGNVYRGNVFDAVSGTLTLRHGNGCLVEVNVFIGRGEKGTGGIRIIGEDHIVRSNYLDGLRGDDARSGITMMLGIPNSPANGYFQVKRARVEANILVDCKHPLMLGYKGKTASLPPVECVMSKNLILAMSGSVVIDAPGDISGIRWEGNVAMGKALGIPATAGIEWETPKITKPSVMERRETGPSW